MTRRTATFAGILLALIFAACGGGGGEEQEPAATTLAGGTATQAPVAESPTPRPEDSTPAAAASPAARFSLCLVEPEDADEALGEFVTGFPGGNLNCTYQTESGIYLRFELGSPEDFQAGAELEGVRGKPVSGIGEEAVWFGGVQFPSHHFNFDEIVTLGVLSMRQGDVYFRIMLNLPELDSAAQLEVALDLAAIAIPRLP